MLRRDSITSAGPSSVGSLQQSTTLQPDQLSMPIQNNLEKGKLRRHIVFDQLSPDFQRGVLVNGMNLLPDEKQREILKQSILHSPYRLSLQKQAMVNQLQASLSQTTRDQHRASYLEKIKTMPLEELKNIFAEQKWATLDQLKQQNHQALDDVSAEQCQELKQMILEDNTSGGLDQERRLHKEQVQRDVNMSIEARQKQLMQIDDMTSEELSNGRLKRISELTPALFLQELHMRVDLNSREDYRIAALAKIADTPIEMLRNKYSEFIKRMPSVDPILLTQESLDQQITPDMVRQYVHTTIDRATSVQLRQVVFGNQFRSTPGRRDIFDTLNKQMPDENSKQFDAVLSRFKLLESILRPTMPVEYLGLEKIERIEGRFNARSMSENDRVALSEQRRRMLDMPVEEGEKLFIAGRKWVEKELQRTISALDAHTATSLKDMLKNISTVKLTYLEYANFELALTLLDRGSRPARRFVSRNSQRRGFEVRPL